MNKLSRANVAALIILVLLALAYYFPYTPHTIYVSTNTSTSASAPPTYTTHTSTSPTHTTRISISVLISATLNKINEERQKFGVPPVRFFNDTTARFRAEDMYNNKYFGHCDLNGMPPNYHYTRLGGNYVTEENAGYTYSVGWNLIPTSAAVRHVENMIYDDADSNWGHRDSILDPTNNFVSIYATWDNNRFFLVIHMMKIWVTWIKTPTIKDAVFTAEGIILLNNSKLDDIIVYYSSPNKSRTFDLSLNIITTCETYSVGEPIAGVVPEPYYYSEIQTIRPLKWVVSEQYFSVEFPINFTSKRGLYTIVIWVENTLHTKHPFVKERYSDYLPILMYTFFAGSS